ncbi:MAG: epoxide hydrolase family protein [Caulobacterales bacterium]
MTTGGAGGARNQPWPGTDFRIETPDDVLVDLRDRLRRTRFPRYQAGPDWARGAPIGFMQRLRDYWIDGFDWRAWEARFNAFNHRLIDVDGRTLHVIVERGSGDAPAPLLLTNGWPGSFTEFLPIIERLAHPERFGGRAEDAFTVIAPSLPGYGFSPAPDAPLSPSDIAALFSRLMTEVLGFDGYVAYGSDWGSLITAKVAFKHPEGLKAFLITSAGGAPVIDEARMPLTADEIAWRQRSFAQMAPESAYQAVQATKPQTLAFGQTDSPIGLAAWIVEKFHGWTIRGSTDDPPFSMDDLLANVMLYWINGCEAPMWLYASLATDIAIGPHRCPVPAGFLFAPMDMTPPPPQSYLDRVYDVAHYEVLGRGGHFPGLETPHDLVRVITAFLGRYR